MRASKRVFVLAAVALSVVMIPIVAAARAPLLDEQRGVLTMAPVLERVTPAVVSVAVATRLPGDDNPLLRDPFFRRYFGVPERGGERQAMSAGSGVIIDARRGLVVTNHHVIANAERITVTVKDGRQLKAKLIGSDEATDIGLLEIEPARLSELLLGDSDQLRIGDVVLAIGNPFGLGQTVTSGIVSALGRAGLGTEKYESFIQTDAPINPGNSGGALINSKGELVGINTAIIAPAGGNVGIGFAVPTSMVKTVVDQLLKHGSVKRGRIGIAVQTATPEIAKALGVPVERGAVIGSVEKGSPAEQAGLRSGDLITAIDGREVADANDVRNRIGLKELGSVVEITYYRKAQMQSVKLTIAEERAAALDGGGLVRQLAGARFTEIPADHPRKSRIEGVLVAEVQAGSMAWRVGLRSGDIIFGLNQVPLRGVADLESVARAASGVLALNVLRGDAQLLIVAQG
jgi:Do/DeqQ family serine protease